MRVELDGKKYLIEFEHKWVLFIGACGKVWYAASEGPQHHPENDPRNFREQTLCHIQDVSAPSPVDRTAPVVATGSAIRYYRDPSNREVGRKQALKKAVEALFPHNVIIHEGVEARIAERAPGPTAAHRAFWDAYRSRTALGPNDCRVCGASTASGRSANGTCDWCADAVEFVARWMADTFSGKKEGLRLLEAAEAVSGDIHPSLAVAPGEETRSAAQ